VLKFVRSWLPLSGRSLEQARVERNAPLPPDFIEVDGAEDFPLADHLQVEHGLPVPDWGAVSNWIEGMSDPSAQATAWARVELGWLAHLRAALGDRYHLTQSGAAVLLSSLEPSLARVTVGFMIKAVARIEKVLDGLAKAPEWGHNILVVFDDDEAYYRYISRYYAEPGEFAGSGGMHIGGGCSHFVTVKSDLHAVEPVIVHELTHGCLSHLSLPAWLNEGLAVNTELRLCAAPAPLFTPQEMHAKHLQFWRSEVIQEFWSGKSFLRADDGNMLSYDLARILVSQFAGDWAPFKEFAREARAEDAGQSAALKHLRIDLGAAVCAILEQPFGADWSPQPGAWREPPEKGGFRR
jgi:hypothetical protein